MFEQVPLTINEVHECFANLAREIRDRSDVRIDSVEFSWVTPFGTAPILLGISIESETTATSTTVKADTND